MPVAQNRYIKLQAFQDNGLNCKTSATAVCVDNQRNKPSTNHKTALHLRCVPLFTKSLHSLCASYFTFIWVYVKPQVPYRRTLRSCIMHSYPTRDSGLVSVLYRPLSDRVRLAALRGSLHRAGLYLDPQELPHSAVRRCQVVTFGQLRNLV